MDTGIRAVIAFVRRHSKSSAFGWQSLAACSILQLASVLTGCSTETTLTNLYNNREYIGDTLMRPISVAQARETFLIKSSEIFYPEGMPDDPAELPALLPQQMQALEKMLDGLAARVDATFRAHSEIFLDEDEITENRSSLVDVRLLNQRMTVAGTDDEGTLYLDALVVQAVYRTSLILVLSAERPDFSSPFAPFFSSSTVVLPESLEDSETERQAFIRFAEFRQRLGEVSPLLPLSDLRAVGSGIADEAEEADEENSDFSDRIFSGMGAVVEQRMRDQYLLKQSSTLEEVFIGSLEFLIAHEAAHLFGGDFPVATECEEAKKREFSADVIALFSSYLAQFDKAPGYTLNRSDEGALKIEGGFLWKPSPSYLYFFLYAYDLAQFDSSLSDIPGCEYEPPEQRAATTHVFAELLYRVFANARYAEAERTSRSRELRESAAEDPFADTIRELLEDSESGDVLPPTEIIKALEDDLRTLFYTYYKG